MYRYSVIYRLILYTKGNTKRAQDIYKRPLIKSGTTCIRIYAICLCCL